MILRKKEIVDELASRCNFFKKDTEDFVEALEGFFIDTLSEATLDDDVEIHLTKGIVIGARRIPEKDGVNPRTHEQIKVSERISPYAKFTFTFKQKINE